MLFGIAIGTLVILAAIWFWANVPNGDILRLATATSDTAYAARVATRINPGTLIVSAAALIFMAALAAGIAARLMTAALTGSSRLIMGLLLGIAIGLGTGFITGAGAGGLLGAFVGLLLGGYIGLFGFGVGVIGMNPICRRITFKEGTEIVWSIVITVTAMGLLWLVMQ